MEKERRRDERRRVNFRRKEADSEREAATSERGRLCQDRSTAAVKTGRPWGIMRTILASLSAVNLRTAWWRAAAAKSYPGRDRTRDRDRSSEIIHPTHVSEDRLFSPYGEKTLPKKQCKLKRSLIYAYTRGDIGENQSSGLQISWKKKQQQKLKHCQECRFNRVYTSTSIILVTLEYPSPRSTMRTNNWLTNNASTD